MLNIAITGAASGLGRVIAERFSKIGYRVFACDSSEEAIAELGRSGFVALATRVDVSDREQIESWFKDIYAKSASLDVLVNNVGVAGPHAGVEEMELKDWHETLNANLHSALITVRLALPAMKRARSGSIINVSTISVSTNPVHRVPYVVSKAALEALTLAVAREAGPFNIRCNAVRPGMMNNERLMRILRRVAAQSGRTVEEVEGDQLRYIWMRKKVEMLEVSQLIEFLASDAACSITGQIISVDGGMSWEE